MFTMDLFSGLSWFLPIVLAVAVVAAVTILATVGVVVSRNRQVRLARHESIPAYYRHALLAH